MTKEKLYTLNHINEWANDDKEWLLDFLKLLQKEITKKINKIKQTIQNDSPVEFDLLHQLSSQISLLGNEEINSLVREYEAKAKAKENLPINGIDNLITKSEAMLSQLQNDYKL